MKRFSFALGILPVVFTLLLLTSTDSAWSSDKTTGRTPQLSGPHKLLGVPVSTLININNVAGWVRNDGWSARIPSSGNSGVFFPRGTGAAIFADGLIWGGNVNDGGSQVLRVGGQTYSIGTSGGRIISPGVAASPGDPDVRIYRIRRDFNTANLRQDAAELAEKSQSTTSDAEVASVRAQYETDWLEWPADQGAPFYDADSNGTYEPRIVGGAPVLFPDADEPGIADADQVIWFVNNDLNSGLTNAFLGSNPIGLEFQVTLWGYNRTDPLANVYFKKFTFIYKGTATTPPNATITDMYIAQWSDPDLGDFGNDFVGMDTTLSMAYVYNSAPVDNAYALFGLAPPAIGYDFLQGPLVEGVAGQDLNKNGVDDAVDFAVFGLKKRGPGFINLPMTASFYFAAGSSISDPPFSREGTIQWYNLIRGLIPISGAGFVYPGDTEPTLFWLDGDPVTGTGRVDGVVDSPGDRRLGLCSGPFTMAVGDTQEMVLGVVGGVGADFLSAITVMKNNDIAVQNAYNDLFDLPKAPPSPKLQVAELDQQLVLDWGFDDELVKEIESFDAKGYTFQGYNVYQFPFATAGFTQAIKLGTFDLVDGVRTIFDDVFDPGLGIIKQIIKQEGTDAGIRHVLEVNQDKVRIFPFVNGQRYYFGVTSYGYNPDPTALTHALESSFTIVEAIPRTPDPGTRLSAAHGDTVTTVIHTGASDGKVEVLVVDPNQLTGHQYKVTFDTSGGDIVWNVDDMTSGQRMLSNQTNQSGDEAYSTVDGMLIKVFGAPSDFKDFQTVANAAGPIDPPEGFAADFQGFPSLRPTDGQQVGAGHWFFHTGDTDPPSRGSYGAFLSRSMRGDNFSQLVPFDWEMRFTAEGSFAVGVFTDGLVRSVPFELWNVGINTPDDPSDDYRVIPWFLELAAVATNDRDIFVYEVEANDHAASGGTNDPYTDWIYWRIPEDTSPGTAGYDAYVASLDFSTTPPNQGTYDDNEGHEVIARSVLVNWNGGDVTDPMFYDIVNQSVPEEGTIFRIISTKPNQPFLDEFTFAAPAAGDFTAGVARDDISLINVFPNPYYGFNRAETDKFGRFVTFNHLPPRAEIRIFNLSGALVKAFDETDATLVRRGQYQDWDLTNQAGLPVASGLYIAYLKLKSETDEDLGTKILKIVIIQEQQFLDRF